MDRHQRDEASGVSGTDQLAPADNLLPSFIVFGGARYERATKRSKPIRNADTQTDGKAAHTLARDTVGYMTHQLKLASVFLHLEPNIPSSCSPKQAAQNGELMLLNTSAQTCDSFSLRNIWTTAYAAGVKELQTLLENDCSAINAKGFVVYNRRQLGVKKLSEKFVLGLGQKGSPLQYAAMAGHIDSVLLLLTRGAEDDSYPYLKDILGDEMDTTVKSMSASFRAEQKEKRMRGKEKPRSKAVVIPPSLAVE
uniref:Uncharacterized protein n=1 Tax=Trypanosoma congolense (strain IL3000) TaxID=1068625 RepID=G0UX10_TRYCI|nr:conserved hypothetical protein [Trypanosoma congolense IL3000]